jgi:thiosulfate dehydrogenase [quinone] large subunit
MLPLRAFLGFTFCYAGLMKLANPNFFNSASTSSIQAQLIASDRTSPLHFLLEHLVHFATPIGVLIALGELAVGLGALLGLWTRVAAVGGMALSLTLFLTVSFHSSPYFTGADIVFLFAWTPLVVAGAGGVLSLDALVAARARRLAVAAVRARGARHARPDEFDRRRFALGAAAVGAVAVVGMVAAGLAAGVGRLVGGAKAPAGSAPVTLSAAGKGTPTTSAATPTSSGGTAPTTTSTTVPVPSGTRLGPASDVPVGGWARFTDPASGDPAVVLQLTKGSFVAYDAVCPHAGCTVGYSPAAQLIVCPCHGSQFDPATGAVVQGPAPRGLGHIAVAEGPDDDLYVDG